MEQAAIRRRLLDGVASIHATLEAQVEAEEKAATLSAESVAALAEAGVLAMKLPRELGGFEADPSTQILVLEALAEINASASWCTMVGATGIGLPGAFLDDAAVSKIFAGGGIPPRRHRRHADGKGPGRGGRLPPLRALALRQRHPPRRLAGRRRQGRERGRRAARDPRHDLPRRVRGDPRQLASRRAGRHGQLRFLGRGHPRARQLHLGARGGRTKAWRTALSDRVSWLRRQRARGLRPRPRAARAQRLDRNRRPPPRFHRRRLPASPAAKRCNA